MNARFHSITMIKMLLFQFLIAFGFDYNVFCKTSRGRGQLVTHTHTQQNVFVIAYFATVKPRFSDLPDTICRATFTIELPQAAPAPLNPSSVPNGFEGFL